MVYYSWKPLVKQHTTNVSRKISKSIGISYKSRGTVKQPLLKRLYFSFIHFHCNYANIAWANTYKSKLERLYRHQKYALHIINFKNKFIYAQALLHDMKALKIFQINLFRIIYFMFKCKETTAPAIFHSLFTPKPEDKHNIWSRGKLAEPFYRKKRMQFKIDYRGLYLWYEIAHHNFSKLQSFAKNNGNIAKVKKKLLPQAKH